jgi:hypothetical protein
VIAMLKVCCLNLAKFFLNFEHRCKMAGAGFPSLAKLHAQIYTADCGNPRCLERMATNKITVMRIATDRNLNLRADCHRHFLAAFYSLLPERGAWQSASHLRAVCQVVIPTVANRSI